MRKSLRRNILFSMGLYHRIYGGNIYILRQQTGEEFSQIIALTNSTLKVKASINEPMLNPVIIYREDMYAHNIHNIKED